MRMTFSVSTARKEGYMRMPLLKHSAEDYFDSEGNLDEARVRSELGRLGAVQFSSNDDRSVLVVAMDIIDRVKTATERFEGTHRSNAVTESEERMERGRYATVRLDVSRRADGYRVALRVSSPNEIPVKGAVDFARIFAQVLADNVIAVRDDIAADRKAGDPDIRFSLVEGEGCEGIFAKSEKRNAHALLVKELRGKYAACERRHDCRTGAGVKLCSPCLFSCPCFRDGGRCAYEDIIEGKEN